MMDFDNEESKKAINGYAIFLINIVCLFIYLAAFVKSNRMPDSVAEFLLLCHVLICIVWAVKTKRPAWWVSACVVVLPLISLLLSSR